MKLLLTLTLLLLAAAPVARAQIYADVETVNLSTAEELRFTIELDQLYSPGAVANFIKLVEGTQPWVDAEGIVHYDEPFYDGLTFYSMMADLEASVGSPGNDGLGGPGYIFRDDFRSSAIYSPLFSVYMENNGPNTNGSRFFINLPNTTTLGRTRPSATNYSRIGAVLNGSNPPGQAGQINVRAISYNTPGNIEIESITIRRVGALAEAFDEFSPTWELPTVEPSVYSFRRQDGTFYLDWDNVPGSAATIFSSRDLMNWDGPFLTANAPGGSSFGLDLTPTIDSLPELFFRGATIRYPSWPSTERPLPNAAIQVIFNGSTFSIIYFFDGSGLDGVWQGYNNGFPVGGSGNIKEVEFEPIGPFAAKLLIRAKNLPTYRFTLDYDLDGTTFTTTNPSRHTAEEIDESGEEPVLTGTFDGFWTYTP